MEENNNKNKEINNEKKKEQLGKISEKYKEKIEKNKKQENIKKEEIKEREKELELKKENKQDNLIQITPEVVETIAGVAISEVKGVSQNSSFLQSLSNTLKNKSKESQGIKAEIESSNVVIDANIVVDYGTRIPDVAFEIQSKVKKSVEAMTGLNVKEVNVHVQGINRKKSEVEK